MEYLEIRWRPEEDEAGGRDGGGGEEPAFDNENEYENEQEAAEAAAALARIRELMEGTATYRALSGASAVIAGVIGLAACAASAAVLAGAPGAPVLRMAPLDGPPFRALAAIWAAAFVSAAAVELVLTKREARRAGSACFHFPGGSPMLRRMRLAYGAPLVVGAALTLALARAGASDAIPAAWLLSYGAAVACAGLFSTRPVRRLGAAFLALGVAAAAAPALNLALLAAGFGLAHVVYGAAVLSGGNDS